MPRLKQAQAQQPPHSAECASAAGPAAAQSLDGPALVKKYQRKGLSQGCLRMKRFFIEEYIAHLTSHGYDEQQRYWDIPDDFKYLILSYGRPKVLRKNAWAYLKECGIPNKRITVEVQNEQD